MIRNPNLPVTGIPGTLDGPPHQSSTCPSPTRTGLLRSGNPMRDLMDIQLGLLARHLLRGTDPRPPCLR